MNTANMIKIALGANALWVGFGRAPQWSKWLVGIGGALALANAFGVIKA